MNFKIFFESIYEGINLIHAAIKDPHNNLLPYIADWLEDKGYANTASFIRLMAERSIYGYQEEEKYDYFKKLAIKELENHNMSVYYNEPIEIISFIKDGEFHNYRITHNSLETINPKTKVWEEVKNNEELYELIPGFAFLLASRLTYPTDKFDEKVNWKYTQAYLAELDVLVKQFLYIHDYNQTISPDKITNMQNFLEKIKHFIQQGHFQNRESYRFNTTVSRMVSRLQELENITYSLIAAQENLNLQPMQNLIRDINRLLQIA